jgi:starch synthase
MIAMRYGCIPVARATGGLADTIIDVDTSADSTGLLFRKASPQTLKKTMLRVLDFYQDQEKWLALQKRGMAVDFSWKKSALEYVNIYEELVYAE